MVVRHRRASSSVQPFSPLVHYFSVACLSSRISTHLVALESHTIQMDKSDLEIYQAGRLLLSLRYSVAGV
jgi:hypothetical protein